MKPLSEIIESEYPDYTDLVSDIKDAAKRLYSSVVEYSDEKINVVSHLADADGFGCQIILHKGLELMLDSVWNGNTQVDSHRIMSFSQDPESKDSAEGVKSKMGEGLYVISDLATLKPEEAQKHFGEGVIIDHHMPADFGPNFINANPSNHGFDGGAEVSASVGSALVMHYLFDMIEDYHQTVTIPDLGDDREAVRNVGKQIKSQRETLDFLTIFALAGSKADMQEDTGLNKALYDYMTERGVLEKIHYPHFGYSTKDMEKVVAQSSIPLNLKYTFATHKDITGMFAQKFGVHTFKERKDYNNTDLDDFLTDYKHLFVREYDDMDGSLLVNRASLNSMTASELEDFDLAFSRLAGASFFEIEYDEGSNVPQVNIRTDREGDFYFGETDEDCFSEDDIKKGDNRITAAKHLLRARGLDPEKAFSKQSEGLDGEEFLESQEDFRKQVHFLYADNIKAFCPPELREFYLKKLDQDQYFMTAKEGIVADRTIAELANMMTAMSKLEKGDEFMSILNYEVAGDLSSRHQSELESIKGFHNHYRLCVFLGMSQMENTILYDGSKKPEDRVCKKLLPNAFYMNIPEIDESKFTIDMRKMNGVLGGLAANVRLLPNNPSVLFTGHEYEGMYNGEKTSLIKISGRYPEHPMFYDPESTDYVDIHLGELMTPFGGGGHKGAAACVIRADEADHFMSQAKKYLKKNGL